MTDHISHLKINHFISQLFLNLISTTGEVVCLNLIQNSDSVPSSLYSKMYHTEKSVIFEQYCNHRRVSQLIFDFKFEFSTLESIFLENQSFSYFQLFFSLMDFCKMNLIMYLYTFGILISFQNSSYSLFHPTIQIVFSFLWENCRLLHPQNEKLLILRIFRCVMGKPGKFISIFYRCLLENFKGKNTIECKTKLR